MCFCVWSLFGYAVLSVLSSFAIISLRKRELVAILSLYYWGHVTVSVLCLILTVLQVGLQFVNMTFSDHTHLFLQYQKNLLYLTEVLWDIISKLPLVQNMEYQYSTRHLNILK